MAHTPGPWTHDEGEPHLVAGDPETMFDCYYIFDADGNCIAIIPDDPYLGLSVLDNIRLIDASPDLLAACKYEGNRSDVLLAAATLLEMKKFSEIAAILREKAKLEKVAIARAEGAAPACSSCGSVFQPNEPQRSGDDGPLCGDCYGRLHGERDRADERYRLGDIQFDQSRGN